MYTYNHIRPTSIVHFLHPLCIAIMFGRARDAAPEREARQIAGPHLTERGVARYIIGPHVHYRYKHFHHVRLHLLYSPYMYLSWLLCSAGDL